jgi:Thioredoxin-like
MIVKKTYLIGLLAMVSLQSLGQGINFIYNDIRQAFNLARTQGKMVMVEVYSKSCHHCASFEPIFKEKPVADFYNKNFVNYRLEVSTDDVRQFLTPKKIFAPSLPLFLFFDANQNLQHFAVINNTVADMLREAQEALTPASRAINFRNRYAAGERGNDFLFDLAMYCRIVCDTTFNIKIMDEYARRTPATTYADKTNWLVVQKLVMDVENPMAKHLIDNYALYKKKYNPEEVKFAAENLLMSSLYSSRGNRYNAAQIQAIRKGLVKIGIGAESANARTLLPETKYYFQNRQMPQAIARTEDYFNNTKAQVADYKYIIGMFNQRATDKSYVPALTKWVNKALTMTPPNSPDAQVLKQELAKAQARK